MTTEVLAIAATGVTLLAVIVSLHIRLCQRIDDVRRETSAETNALRQELSAEINALRQELNAEINALRQELSAVNTRLARIEGAVLGPWRPGEPEDASTGTTAS